MKKNIYIAVAAVVIAATYSCGGEREKKEKKEEVIAVDSSVVIGGKVVISDNNPHRSICPGNVEDISSMHVSQQIFEGLVCYNQKTLEIMPLLADKWEVSSDGLQYTFYLRKGVRFHDNPCFEGGKGRELKASDVVYSFHRLADAKKGVYGYNSTIKGLIKGADEYFNASLQKDVSGMSIEGIKALDDYTVQFTLTVPTKNFLNILANVNTAIVAKESIDMYSDKNVVGTGPFKYTSGYDASGTLYLVKNESYWGVDKEGNKLPYLDTIAFVIVDTKREELERFEKNKIDIVFGIPSENIKEFVEKDISKFEQKPPQYVLNRVSALATQYYEFNLTLSHFANRKVRQAFNYAIDRKKIIEEVLKGEAYAPAEKGFVPLIPLFKEYGLERIKGYGFDPEKAKKLMAEAGYPGGKNFPTVKLVLNSGGAKNTNVALEVQKQLFNVLGVNMEMEIVPFDKKIEIAKYAQADMVRSAWAADYPSPESFMLVFYGKNVPAKKDQESYPNSMRYVNEKYDQIFEKMLREINDSIKKELIIQAELMVLEDAPILYLWYDEVVSLTNGKVLNFGTNALNYISFREVYKIK